jgi:hypothetical protein
MQVYRDATDRRRGTHPIKDKQHKKCTEANDRAQINE